MHIYLPEDLIYRIESSFQWYENRRRPLSRTVKQNLLDNTYFLCLLIIRRIAQRKDNSNLRQAANVRTCEMKYYINEYPIVLGFLKDNFILRSTEPYSTGQKGNPAFPRAYRFYDPMDQSNIVKLELHNPYLLPKLKGTPKVVNVPPYLERYRDEILSKVSLHTDSAESFLINDYQNGLYSILDFYRLYWPIFRFKSGDLYFKQDKARRLYHNFNSLSSRFWKFLRIENEENPDWVEVDVSACTPFLFSSYLIQKGHTKRDVLIFHDIAKSGSFYTRLLEYITYVSEQDEGYVPEEIQAYIGKGNRSRLKEAILKFFNRTPDSNRNRSNGDEFVLYEYVRGCFPTVFKHLERIQNDNIIEEEGKGGMYHLLTPMESSVMIEYLIPKLLEKQLIAITRHDGVLCQRRDAEQIKAIIEEGFRVKLRQVPYVKSKVLPNNAY